MPVPIFGSTLSGLSNSLPHLLFLLERGDVLERGLLELVVELGDNLLMHTLPYITFGLANIC